MSSPRRLSVDLLMICWGIGAWLGVNSIQTQYLLLLKSQPETYMIASYASVAIQSANIGILIYFILRKLLPKIPDAVYIYGLMSIGVLALTLNAFLYDKLSVVFGSMHSTAFLTLTFFSSLVGCMSSVVFYPYLIRFRNIYLTTYLLGEGLGSFLIVLFGYIQGVIAEPECVQLNNDSPLLIAKYAQPRFNTTVFLLPLAVLTATSLISFIIIDNYNGFHSQKIARRAEARTEKISLLNARWLVLLIVNALSTSLLPSLQIFAIVAYGVRAFIVTLMLSNLVKPFACVMAMWFPLVGSQFLAIMLGVTMLPLCYIMTILLLNPNPPLLDTTFGVVLIVVCWVLVSGVLFYVRMWLVVGSHAGGIRGLRTCGVIMQLGNILGHVAYYLLLLYTSIALNFPEVCRSASHLE